MGGDIVHIPSSTGGVGGNSNNGNGGSSSSSSGGSRSKARISTTNGRPSQRKGGGNGNNGFNPFNDDHASSGDDERKYHGKKNRVLTTLWNSLVVRLAAFCFAILCAVALGIYVAPFFERNAASATRQRAQKLLQHMRGGNTNSQMFPPPMPKSKQQEELLQQQVQKHLQRNHRQEHRHKNRREEPPERSNQYEQFRDDGGGGGNLKLRPKWIDERRGEQDEEEEEEGGDDGRRGGGGGVDRRHARHNNNRRPDLLEPFRRNEQDDEEEEADEEGGEEEEEEEREGENDTADDAREEERRRGPTFRMRDRPGDDDRVALPKRRRRAGGGARGGGGRRGRRKQHLDGGRGRQFYGDRQREEEEDEEQRRRQGRGGDDDDRRNHEPRPPRDDRFGREVDLLQQERRRQQQQQQRDDDRGRGRGLDDRDEEGEEEEERQRRQQRAYPRNLQENNNGHQNQINGHGQNEDTAMGDSNNSLASMSTVALESKFTGLVHQHQQQLDQQQRGLEQQRGGDHHHSALPGVHGLLQAWRKRLQKDIHDNVRGGIRWLRPNLLPPIPTPAASSTAAGQDEHERRRHRHGKQRLPRQNEQEDRAFFNVKRMHKNHNKDQQGPMKWEQEWEQMQQQQQQGGNKGILGPALDYTDRTKYVYPPIMSQPPASGGYPALSRLDNLMQNWHQDEDFNGKITETLIHFNYSNPRELEMARKFRDAELPFKLYDVPEISAATRKWTDEYLSWNFGKDDSDDAYQREGESPYDMPRVYSASAQESPNNYFAFFIKKLWNVREHGLPPTVDNDWTFAKWSQHAKYADAVRLRADQPHFYWQVGIDRTERYQPRAVWSFVSRDLPTMSSPDETFLVFHPEEQKGIQCRFGERGVVAATHYDSGRNMVAMITGAKRYILSPPHQCSKLGIFSKKESPMFRHSYLNFGHLRDLRQQQTKAHNNTSSMSREERAWLERAAGSMAVETVLKAGEVLYIPSFWFHYIISLQKSAQCNVRSGMEQDDNKNEFGSRDTVERCTD